MPKEKRYVLKTGNEKRPIEVLTEILTGRVFDFECRTGDLHQIPVTSSDQRLTDQTINPIRLERRCREGREYLIFVVEDPDDLMVSISSSGEALTIDLSQEQLGLITITNKEGDLYRFRIKK